MTVMIDLTTPFASHFSRTTDPPPVYADVICIPPIREEEPPSYQDVIVTMESAL